MSTAAPHAVVVDRPADLLQRIGEPIGPSSWFAVEQSAVNAFGSATGDEQWIHVDVERAAQGPFGTTIAHGYLSVALIAPLFGEVVLVHDTNMVVNYGLDRVRFPAPVLLPARVRLTGLIANVEQLPNGIQLTADITLEIEGGDKPACVARVLYRYLP